MAAALALLQRRWQPGASAALNNQWRAARVARQRASAARGMPSKAESCENKRLSKRHGGIRP